MMDFGGLKYFRLRGSLLTETLTHGEILTRYGMGGRNLTEIHVRSGTHAQRLRRVMSGTTITTVTLHNMIIHFTWESRVPEAHPALVLGTSP